MNLKHVLPSMQIVHMLFRMSLCMAYGQVLMSVAKVMCQTGEESMSSGVRGCACSSGILWHCAGAARRGPVPVLAAVSEAEELVQDSKHQLH
jgi:hypothetical protein